MNIIAVAGIGVISAVLCMIVRQYRPEAAFGVSIACGVVITAAALAMLAPSIEKISSLIGSVGAGDYAGVLLKALAVCYITQICADCCKDAGENAIASKIELAGKAAIIAVSLPVFTSLAEIVTKLLNT